jgi:hypothetical protein
MGHKCGGVEFGVFAFLGENREGEPVQGAANALLAKDEGLCTECLGGRQTEVAGQTGHAKEIHAAGVDQGQRLAPFNGHPQHQPGFGLSRDGLIIHIGWIARRKGGPVFKEQGH